MDIMFLSLTMFILGAIIYTAIGYIAKYLKDPQTAFNTIYIFTALLSMFLVILLSPTFLLPGILPFKVAGTTGYLFVIVSCFSLGFSANFLLNLPITFLLKQITNHNIIDALKPKPRYIIYLVAFIGIIALITGASVNALAQYDASFHTTGTIKTPPNISVYSNAALTMQLEVIDWGTQEPGEHIGQITFIKNTGSYPIQLSLYTSDWTPAQAQSYMTVTWDYDLSVLQPNEVKQVWINLDISDTITGITDFSFDIHIVAEDYS